MDLLTPDRIRLFVEGMITLILSIAVHEFGHAWVADKLGDRLPRSQGRVTLNPLAHADPIGTLALPGIPLLLYGFMGFGWGRPVQTNPAAYTRKVTMRTGHLLVAAAGPTMNVLFAVFLGLVALLLTRTGVLSAESHLYVALLNALGVNFLLAIFNLLPAPPLDGGTVIYGLLPTRLAQKYEPFMKYGFFVILAVIIIPGASAIIRIPAGYLARGLAYGILQLPYPLAG